jgi:hypothetical protein
MEHLELLLMLATPGPAATILVGVAFAIGALIGYIWLFRLRRLGLGIILASVGLAGLSAAALVAKNRHSASGDNAGQTIQRFETQINELQKDLTASLAARSIAQAQLEANENSNREEIRKLVTAIQAMANRESGKRVEGVDLENFDFARVHHELRILEEKTNQLRPDYLVASLVSIPGTVLSTKYYEANLLPSSEIVAGAVGKYLRVRFKGRASNKYIEFVCGRYELDDEVGFKLGLHQLYADMVGEPRLFIRGTADARSCEGSTPGIAPKYKYIDVLYFDKERERYEPQARPKEVGNPVRNVDLPNLRAAYARELAKPILRRESVELLDGLIANEEPGQARIVEFILLLKI